MKYYLASARDTPPLICHLAVRITNSGIHACLVFRLCALLDKRTNIITEKVFTVRTNERAVPFRIIIREENALFTLILLRMYRRKWHDSIRQAL